MSLTDEHIDEKKKLCRGCNELKDVDLFSLSSKYKDGRQTRCKQCMATYYQARHKEIRDEQRRYWEQYSSSNQEHLKQKSRQYRKCNGDKLSSYKKQYASNNGPKVSAKNIVRSYILTGRLVKLPCEVCGKNPADAHHDDYQKPLDVRWLCRKHHKAWHVENGEGKNGT